MQNKGLIGGFTVLFALACLFSLSLTWVGIGVENDAKDYADGNSAKEYAYLDSMSTEEVYPVIDYTYGELRTKMLNLGLDLKGGMNVTLEVQIDEVVRALSSFSEDKAFIQAIVDAKKLQAGTSDDFITLFEKAYNEKNPNRDLVAIFRTLDNKERITSETTEEEVLEFIREEAEAAIETSFKVLRTRINLFGAAQPSIQRLTGSDRILVELPGVKNKERVRQLLQGTAKLEFWDTYENAELAPTLENANNKLAELQKIKTGKSDTTSDESEGVADLLGLDLDTNEVDALEEDTTSSKEETSLLQDIVSADSASSDTTGGLEANQSAEEYAKNNPLFAVLTPNIYQGEDGQYYRGKGPVLGYAQVKDTSKINGYLNLPQIKTMFKRIKFLWTKQIEGERPVLQLLAMKIDNREGKPLLEGDVIVDASQQIDQLSGSPQISMTMNTEGRNKWKNITKKASEDKPDNSSIAIVLDNVVYTFPRVSGEIPNGVSQISGNFTIEEAKLIANILKAGKLPVSARIVEEAVVGPTLGEESISKGLKSFGIALLIVLAYMIFYYSKAGIASVIALLANMFFIFGVLASMPALVALTLPGIAGIILTIGMSVDANVLIFERIREELTAGKGMRLAVADGYKQAYTSIVDANVTTLLTGFVLWFFGTGPIEGFAKTLVIGIFTSLFTAIFITRLIFEFNLNRNKILSFSTKLTEGAFKNLSFKFLKNRKKYYIVSGIVILAGIVSLSQKGLQYGVDFKGGRSYVVRFDEAANTVDIAKDLSVPFESAPEVKTFGGDNQVKITTTYLIDSQDEGADNTVESKLNEGLAGLGKFEIMSSQKVGPTIADDIKTSSVWSILFSLIIIFLYIVFRFRKWQFGIGALFALFHDVLIVLSIFSIFYGILPFSLEIDQAFIAAILTVVGYSINDTVVVFDRIREYLNSFKKREMGEVVNEALNSTLSRTVNTSLSTIFVLAMIFTFGGEVIRGFSFALLVGVIVGTYSSICIAAPVMYDFAKGKKADKKKS